MPKPYTAVLFVLCCFRSFAQDSPSTPGVADQAKQFAISAYYNFTGKQARLYNGLDHAGYFSSIKGNAYYVNDTLTSGDVTYDGLFYSPVLMIYDVYKDELVIRHPSGLRVALLTEKLQEFHVRGHHFVNHLADTSAISALPGGIYDHLYEGKSRMLVRRIKRLNEKVADEVIREFVPEDHYYFYYDGKYRYFKSKNSFFKVFGSRSVDIKRYLRKNKIRFKIDREYAIVEAAKFFDSLN